MFAGSLILVLLFFYGSAVGPSLSLKNLASFPTALGLKQRDIFQTTNSNPKRNCSIFGVNKDPPRKRYLLRLPSVVIVCPMRVAPRRTAVEDID